MIVIIDLNQNNSALTKSLNELNAEYAFSRNETDILAAEKIIISASGEMQTLIKQMHRNNLINVLRMIKKPILGIALGMQLLCEYSADGNVTCLALIPASSEKFSPEDVKIPFTGFNEIKIVKDSKLLKGIIEEDNFYFENPLDIPLGDYSTSSMHYEIDFSVSIEKDNFFGVQFFPEKSGEAGLKILKNFIEI